MTTAYRIEILDVYRKAVAVSTDIYKKADAMHDLGASARRIALAMTMALASGLGFWEREYKVRYFEDAKKATIQLMTLCALALHLGYISSEENDRFADELSELGRSVGGLLRQARRRAAEESQEA